jgi:hypothetical protein
MSPAKRAAPGPALPSPALVRALRRLLRPLVRLLLARQVTHPYLSNLLKSVYVEVAEGDLSGERPSASRLSLFTGIHRKDLRRLREEPAADFTPPAAVSLGARLVQRWTSEPEYLDRRGRPKPLPRVPGDADPDGPSFEELVALVSTDIRPRAVLDEWLRLGVVEIDARDRVRLRADAFVPSHGFDEKAHYFGRNLHDHIAAAAHNLGGDGPPLLERSVHYDGLTAESVAELTGLTQRVGMDALRTVNERARALQRRDAKRHPRLRINFGVYFYRDERPDEETRDD